MGSCPVWSRARCEVWSYGVWSYPTPFQAGGGRRAAGRRVAGGGQARACGTTTRFQNSAVSKIGRENFTFR